MTGMWCRPRGAVGREWPRLLTLGRQGALVVSRRARVVNGEVEVKISRISQGRHLVRIASGSVCLVYLGLVAARLLSLDGSAKAWLTGSAAVGAVCLAVMWHQLRRTSLTPTQVEVLTTLLCLVPIIDSLVVILVAGQLQQSAVLILVMIGAGAVVSTGRALTLRVGTTGVLWAVVLQFVDLSWTSDQNFAGQIGSRSGDQRVHYSLLIFAAMALALFVFLRRTAGNRALRVTRAQVETQWEELVRTQDARAESERRFREIFTASPVGIGLADEQGHFVEVNQAWCDLLGRDRSELLGRSSREFTHPDDLNQHASMSSRMDAAGDGGVVRLEKRYIRPDGSIRWAWLSMTGVHGPVGENWTLAHAQDVTDRKKTEAALRRSEAAQSAAARIARCVQSGEDPRPMVVTAVVELADAIAVALLERKDAETLIVSQVFGIPSPQTLVPLNEPTASTRVWQTGRAMFVSDSTQEPLVKQAFAKVPTAVSMLWQPVLDKSEVIAVLVVGWDRRINRLDDRAVRAVAGLADETASALTALRLRRELESLAETDPLTGAQNRRGWQTGSLELVEQSRVTGQPIHFGLIDFDHFKNYNDTYGHHQGDQLLRDFATDATRALRAGDLIARWGGEEFAVAIPGLDGQDVTALLEKLRVLMPAGQTCSIGFAELRADETPSECMRRADAALYQAKRGGRDRLVRA